MRWFDFPIVAFDTETTGLNTWEGHRVIEFAAVRYRLDEHGREISGDPERIQFLFNPGKPIPREVQELTGIADEDVAHSPGFEAEASRIYALLEGAITVAHNHPFDQAFLAMELQRAGSHWPEPMAEIDTSDLSRRFFPEANHHRLADLAARLEVSLEGAHRAVNDAEACGRSFLILARRHEAPDDLDGFMVWADAVGRPPETGHLARSAQGRVVFLDGLHAGEPVDLHPDVLAWMSLARKRVGSEWQFRYPESIRRWCERWLRIRAAGRAPQGSKTLGPKDWGLDSCALR
jgi:DNA polymerase III epsilon subunit-like protein